MVSNGKIRTPLRLRFCDTDMIGHINNVTFAAFAESGRVDLFNAYEFHASGLILAHLSIDFKAQVKLEDEVCIVSWIESLGSSSMQVRQELLANSEVAATTEAVVVYFDYDTNQPARVPEELRDRIRTVRLDT